MALVLLTFTTGLLFICSAAAGQQRTEIVALAATKSAASNSPDSQKGKT